MSENKIALVSVYYKINNKKIPIGNYQELLVVNLSVEDIILLVNIMISLLIVEEKN